MLSKKKEQEEMLNGQEPGNSVCFIATDTVINGNLEAESDLRIDGRIIGNVTCKGKVVLYPTGVIEGDLKAADADILGTVNGNITTQNLLTLKPQCSVKGNITAGVLRIEPDAVFNGQCNMSSEKTTKQGNGKAVVNSDTEQKIKVQKNTPVLQ